MNEMRRNDAEEKTNVGIKKIRLLRKKFPADNADQKHADPRGFFLR
jgi:hypothetical protein